MVSRFLITTADERTWRFDRPVLFLGDWCQLYDRRSVWENLDAKVAPYHWNDRSKLYKDYLNLNDLYEKLLVDLGQALNEFHRIDHSARYWRILVGPWLGYFTQVLFDRWTMIQYAVQNFNVEGVAALELPSAEAIPNDMQDFIDKFANDTWNSFIYGQILTNWTNVTCEKVVEESKTKDLGDVQSAVPNRSWFRRLRLAIGRELFCTRLFSRQTDAFFISTYLPLLIDFRLQISLGQAPKRWKSSPAPSTFPNLHERNRLILEKPNKQDFDHCVRSLIPKQIPTLYLEGFGELQEIVNTLPWPQRPKVIFTSNSHNSDDIFKSWAASKIEAGFKLVTGQHGGGGTLKWCYQEEHELAISDRYLSWGWVNGDRRNYPTGALQLVGQPPIKWNCLGGILLVTAVYPRYSYWMYSVTVASQVTYYLEDQFRFASALPDHLKSQLLVRLYAHDLGWAQAARWNDRYPDVRIDYGTSPILPLIQRSRIYVATYIGTTFMETFARNVPTIIFWNPKYFELRPSAKPYFELLKQVGIFHETPESAAIKIAEVWHDVAGWWNQSEVKNSVRFFCKNFAYSPNNPFIALKEALTTVESVGI